MLELPAAKAQTKARMNALYAAGVLADAQCDYATARALFEENLAIHREIGDPWNRHRVEQFGECGQRPGRLSAGTCVLHRISTDFSKLGDMHLVAWSIKMLANLAQRQGDFVAARSLYDESLVIFQQFGGRGDIAVGLNDLGNVANAQGDTIAARAAYEQGLVIFREIGNEGAVAIALNNLGNVVCAQADYDTARALFEQSMTIVQKLGDKRGIARLLESFAGLSASQAQPERAVRLAGAAAALRTTLGAPLSVQLSKGKSRTYWNSRSGHCRGQTSTHCGRLVRRSYWNRPWHLPWKEVCRNKLKSNESVKSQFSAKCDLSRR